MEITRLEGCQKVVTQGNDRQSGICSTYPCCGIAWDILGNQCCIVQSYVQRLFQVAAHVFQNWVVTFSECMSSLLFLKIISMLADLWHKWWCGLHWRRSPDQGRLQVIPKWPLIWYDLNPSRKASCCLEVVVVGFFVGFCFPWSWLFRAFCRKAGIISHGWRGSLIRLASSGSQCYTTTTTTTTTTVPDFLFMLIVQGLFLGLAI